MTAVGGSGPPPIPAGKGKEFLTMDPEPFRLVSLDAAAFDWLWRIVEAKHRQFDGRYPEASEVAKRAVISFREAAGTMQPPRVTKILHRKVAKRQ